MADFYQKLGLDRNASNAKIRQAFSQKAREFHPEFNQDLGAKTEFKALVKAFTVLKDPNKRKQYNRLLEMGRINPDSKLKWDAEMETKALDFSKMSFKEFREKGIFLHLFSQHIFIERFIGLLLVAATFALSIFFISGIEEFNVDPFASQERMDRLAPYVAAMLFGIICWTILLAYFRVEFSNYRIRQKDQKKL